MTIVDLAKTLEIKVSSARAVLKRKGITETELALIKEKEVFMFFKKGDRKIKRRMLSRIFLPDSSCLFILKAGENELSRYNITIYPPPASEREFRNILSKSLRRWAEHG